MTDDQSVAELSPRTMPATTRALARRGTTFTNSIVSSPLCCPSRAGLLSGQYPHNNGVFDNEPGYSSLESKASTIYTWLQAAGYRTGHIGRWLLNYTRPAAPTDPPTDGGFAPPPGVEHWFGFVGPAASYYGATFSRNGAPVNLSSDRSGYTTRAINREALAFVRAAASDPRPFFLNVAHIAPHSSNQPAPGECGAIGGLPQPEPGPLARYRTEPLPRPPSFDESRIGDKPSWVRSRSPIGRERRKLLERGWRCALATLTTVDRGVANLIDRLERQGELDDTAIFFTSDNGYLFGQHRIFLNKVYPYEEAIRVPLLARLPGAGQPRRIGALANNLDLTATILDLAGAAPCTASGDCRVLDGRSLLPLLRGRRPPWAHRRGLLVQIGSIRECGVPAPHPGGLETFYDAIRTRRHLYVELRGIDRDTGACDPLERELYDLARDPFQLRNRAAAPALARARGGLAARLGALRACAGVAGRDPQAPGRPYCE
jgi:arylsulfatase A-like enzyme